MRVTGLLIVLTAAVFCVNGLETSITVVDCPGKKTPVRVELFSNNDVSEPAFAKTAITSKTSFTVIFTDMPESTYRVRIFSDTDKNNTLSEQERSIDWTLNNTQIELQPDEDTHVFISMKSGVLKTGSFLFRITDIPRTTGVLKTALFRITEGQKRTAPFKVFSFPVKSSVEEVTCTNIPYGEYAVSIVHDTNSNSKREQDEPAVPGADGTQFFTVYNRDKGPLYLETLFTLDKELYKSEVSLKTGFFRTGTLTIEVKGIKNSKGQILSNLFASSDGFPNERKKAFQYKVLNLSTKKAEITFKNVPFGTYGAGIVHDENSNYKMDTNLFGVPKEGYGASRDARGRFGPPSFKDASFPVYDEEVIIIINISY